MATNFTFSDKLDVVDQSNLRTHNKGVNFNSGDDGRNIKNNIINGNNVNNTDSGGEVSVTYIRRLHVGTNSVNTRDLISKKLLLYKLNNKYITEGLKLEFNNIIAIIIKCDPVGGYLSYDTIFYIEEGLKPIRRIQLLWDIKNYSRLKQYIQLLLGDSNDCIDTPSKTDNQENGKNEAKPSFNSSHQPDNNYNFLDGNLNCCLDGIIDQLSSGYVYYGPFKIERIKLNSKPASTLKLCLINKGSGSNSDNATDINGSSVSPINGGTTGAIVGVEYIKNTTNNTDAEGYSAVIHSLFFNLFNKYLINLLEAPRFYFYGNCQLIGDLRFFTSSIEPNNKPGYIDENTEIYIGFDPYDTYDKITVSPLRDTLPVNYKYNLLKDCVEPFFRLNSFKLYRLGDVFHFSGIQFRITDVSQNVFSKWEDGSDGEYNLFMKWMRMLTCPKYGRVNKSTKIEIGEPVNTKLMDILSPERIEIVRRSAPCYRENLLLCFASDLDLNSLDRIYSNGNESTSSNNSLSNSLSNSLNNSLNRSFNNLNRHGSLNNSTSAISSAGVDGSMLTTQHTGSISSNNEHNGYEEVLNGPIVHRSIRLSKNESVTNGQVVSAHSSIKRDICTVCCEPIPANGISRAKRLGCGHIFHKRCISSWLRNNKSCPNCRKSLSNNSSTNATVSGFDTTNSGTNINTPILPADHEVSSSTTNNPEANTADRSISASGIDVANTNTGTASEGISGSGNASNEGGMDAVRGGSDTDTGGGCVTRASSSITSSGSKHGGGIWPINGEIFQSCNARIRSIWTQTTNDTTPSTIDEDSTASTDDNQVSLDSYGLLTSSLNSDDYDEFSDGNSLDCRRIKNFNDIFNQYEDFENRSKRVIQDSNQSSVADSFYVDWDKDDPSTSSGVNSASNNTQNPNFVLKETDRLVNWQILIYNAIIDNNASSSVDPSDLNYGPGLDINDLNSSEESSNEESDLEEYFNKLSN